MGGGMSRLGILSGFRHLFCQEITEPANLLCLEILGGIRIDVHRRTDVGMSKKILNDLHIDASFAKPRRTGMSEGMTREFRKQHHFTLLLFSLARLLQNLLIAISQAYRQTHCRWYQHPPSSFCPLMSE